MAQEDGQFQMEDVTQSQAAANADHEPFIPSRHEFLYYYFFNGDRKEFPAWNLEIRNKIYTNGSVISSLKNQ
jgi:hypothetical protein